MCHVAEGASLDRLRLTVTWASVSVVLTRDCIYVLCRDSYGLLGRRPPPVVRRGVCLPPPLKPAGAASVSVRLRTL